MAKAKGVRVDDLHRLRREVNKQKAERRKAWRRIQDARQGANLASRIVTEAEEMANKLPEFRQKLVEAEARVTGLELAFKRRYGETREEMGRDAKILRLQEQLVKAQRELDRLQRT